MQRLLTVMGDHPSAWAFDHPVNAAEVTDYYDLTVEQLNDDRLGRALERLAAHAPSIQAALVLKAIEHFQLDVHQIHYDISNAELYLQVGGKDRQRSHVSKLIWNIAETIEHLSAAWELQPGDLIYTGTPEGVAAVVSGDTMVGEVKGLGTLTVKVA